MSVKVYSDILFGEKLERLSEMLKQALLEGLFTGSHNYKPDPFKDEFRASQLPYCSKKLVFNNILSSKTENEAKLDDKSIYIIRAIMNSGTLVHHIIQTLLDVSKLSVVNEGEMEIKIENITIFGHMDIVVLQFEPNYIVCVDIKTKDDFGYLDYYFNADPDVLKEKGLGDPLHHNKIQLNQYLHYLREKYPDKIVFGILWFILRKFEDKQLIYMLHPESWRFFFVDYCPDLFKNTLDKAKNISHCLQNGMLPAFDNEKWECSNKTANCPFLYICFSKTEQIHTVKELLELKEKGNY